MTKLGPRGIWTFAIVGAVVWGAVGIASALPALMSVMLFDAPGSEENTYLWIVFWSLWLFPVGVLVTVPTALLSAWRSTAALKRQLPKVARGWLVALVVGLILPLFPAVGVVTGFYLIETRCGGSFQCPELNE
ncbi:MAG: hypothetical protein AAGF12_42645 [Myxococcota bacterium]